MQDLPAVRLPNHRAKAGQLLQWQKRTDGSWWALVEYIEVVPGFRGHLDPHQSWFPARDIESIPGEDYSRVPRTRAED